MYSPTLDEFLKLATQGNLIPVARRILADQETPLSAYRKIRGQDEAFLFESVDATLQVIAQLGHFLHRQQRQHLCHHRRAG